MLLQCSSQDSIDSISFVMSRAATGTSLEAGIFWDAGIGSDAGTSSEARMGSTAGICSKDVVGAMAGIVSMLELV